jgi:epoxyqueuosine reductase
LRNAAIVLANRGERTAAPALTRALGDEDAVVRHAAAWALAKLDAGVETAP